MPAGDTNLQLGVPDPEVEGSGFVWTEHWYPVACMDELELDRPNAVKLLGRTYVVWRDGQGQWHAFDDRCPHRLAALSEGVLSSDRAELVCVYHGWRFDGAGITTQVPQADPRASKSTWPCATAYPVQLAQDLLWIYPQGGPQGAAAAAQKALPLIPEIDDPSWHGQGSMGFSHWANSLESWLEQGFDPAHAPHLHNGSFGFNYKQATPLDMRVQGKLTPEGFTVTHGGYSTKNAGMKAVRHFNAPCAATFRYSHPDGKEEVIAVYYTPISDYEVRTHGAFLTNKAPAGPLRLFSLLPKGIAHALADIGDQDAIIMSSQERIMRDNGLTWRQYKLATPADGGLAAMRNWLSRVAGPIPYETHSTPADRTLALDRYARHTKYCKHCKQAVRRIDAAAVALQVAAVVLLAAGVALRADSLPSLALSPYVLGSAAAALAVATLRSFRQRYFSRNYVSWQKRPWDGNRFMDICEAMMLVVIMLGNGVWKLLRSPLKRGGSAV